jgi:hypothetical protein
MHDLVVPVRDLLYTPNAPARLCGAAGRRVVERHSCDAMTDPYEAYFADADADAIAEESTPR